MFASANPATKLMQLSKAKAFRVLDQHDCSVRNVHTNFDYGCADQRGRFSAPKSIHDGLLFRSWNTAV
jgi:hypothetical protein